MAANLVFVENLQSRTAAGSLVRVLDKWNVEKTVLSKFAAGFRHAFDLLSKRFSRFAAGYRITECGFKHVPRSGWVISSAPPRGTAAELCVNIFIYINSL